MSIPLCYYGQIKSHSHIGWYFSFASDKRLILLATHKYAFYWPASHATVTCYP